MTPEVLLVGTAGEGSVTAWYDKRAVWLLLGIVLQLSSETLLNYQEPGDW